MERLEMKSCNNLSNGKEAIKVALSSGKIDKYEYLTGKEILPSDKSRIKQQTKFEFSLHKENFEKNQNN